MKQIKRAAVLMLALLFCLTALPVSAAAEATVSAAHVTAKPGDTVVVPIRVTHIEEVVSIGMHVWYDPAVLKCVDAQISDVLSAMELKNANTAPIGHLNEVWLSVIGSTPVVLDGDVMNITFEVLDNAPAGASPVKVLAEGLSISVRTDLREISAEGKDGSVTVEGGVVTDAPSQDTTTSLPKVTTTVGDSSGQTTVGSSSVTTAPSKDSPVATTTAPSAATTTDAGVAEPTTTSRVDAIVPTTDSGQSDATMATDVQVTDAPQTTTDVTDAGQPDVDTGTVVTDATNVITDGGADVTATQTNVVLDPNEAVTRPNGETVPITEETVVDIEGGIVTDASGKPSLAKTVAIMIDEVNATVGDTVTVKVSLSAVADLTALGVSIRYDTKALSFEGGECVGFIKDAGGVATVLENQSGVVDISMASSKSVSGSGDVAQLRFKVKDTAKNGEYRLAVTGGPLVQAGKLELPTTIAVGKILVEGAEEGNANGLYIAIGAVAVAAIAAVIVWVVLRRKKAPPTIAQPPADPPVVDVSGDDE